MKKINIKGFSILEIMVGIFIFSLGVISVYAVIITTLKLNDYNKNYIIASGLAREQLELVRNIRDSNYKKIQIYNQIDPNSSNHTNVLEVDKYYKIENDFSASASFPISVEEITDFGEGESSLSTKMEDYKLCLNSDDMYTFLCDSSTEDTSFYKYIKVEEVEYNDGTDTTISSALKVVSKVIWYRKGYHEFEISSVFTDFKRF